MTQKANLFKAQKKKSIPPNRHGKVPKTKKGFAKLTERLTTFCNVAGRNL